MSIQEHMRLTASSDEMHAIEEAFEVRKNAHCPFSGDKVGACLVTELGDIFTGCKVERAVRGAVICAAQSAICHAVAQGKRNFRLLVAVSKDGSSPCDDCRQLLHEFAPQAKVVAVNESGQVVSRRDPFAKPVDS